MKKLLMSLAVAISMLFAVGGQAKADGWIDGVLTCNQTGPGVTYVLFSSMPVTCTYGGAGPSQTYSGTMGILLGVDLEYAQQRAMAYWVIGGNGSSPALIGNYVGIKGSVTLLAGPALQAGLAGVGNGFELVPMGVGVQQVGFGGAGGLAYLQLTSAGPMPMMAQTFVVYFNFNKSDLTADGQKVVDNAAAYYKKTGSLKVAVAGYTDTSGTAAYNMGLSHRRSDTVRAALIKDGVPAAAITTAWYGKTNLAVPTPDGVKEPRNRRATIAVSGGM
jgi:outer membrane protein OmpA-like peptidoglycan-associated protein